MSDRPVALITGAGRGIGRGIAIELAQNGFDIAANDIEYEPHNRESGLFELKDRVLDSGAGFLPVQGDVSDLNVHDRLISESVEAFGNIDVLVNNAGVAPLKRLDVLDTTAESYDRLMSINTRGAFFLTQKVSRHMIQGAKRESKITPCIVFISSISAEVSSPSRAEYCLSKAALSMAAKIFSDRLSEFGINVYELRPGIIRTDMTAPVLEKYDRLIADGLVPQKRFGLPEDVGRAVSALALGSFSYSSGAVIEISGGMDIRRL
ncbi:3-ketoacyl-ACP reductase [Acidobacteriota bacterium]